MKTKRLMAASVFFIGTLFMVPLAAQEDEGGTSGGGKFGTGKDTIECQKSLSLYREYVKQKSYEEALTYWRRVYSICPVSSKNIYIDGVTLFRWQIDREKDVARRDLYIDTLMQIYDNRIKYFGERGQVLGRKGIDLLRYRRGEQQYIQEGFNILDESVSILKGKSAAPTLATYFTATVSLFKLNALDAGRVVEIWGKVIPYLDEGAAKNPTDKTYPEVKGSVMANFIACGAATPASLTKFYEPLVTAKPDDLALLKEVTSAFVNINAENEALYIKAAELLYAKEPSADAAYKLAKLLSKQESFQKSATYYKEALDKETNPELRAKYYFELAKVTTNLDNAPQARSYALEAIKLKDNWGDPYLLIARLYANSSSTCGTKNIEKYSVFWAAVDKCQRAKAIDPNVAEEANTLINTYSNYFPKREDAFFEGFTDGQTYQVGCWIGESTIVRTLK
jgi:tetratricopeptide (TPR) repeat protein